MKKASLLLLLLLVGMAGFAQQKPENPYPALANEVKTETQRAWLAYKTYAWGHDVLLPLTKQASDWYEHPLYISPIDAYSTLKIMGLDKEAKEIESYVVDSISFNKDIFVKTFEVNIRVLGGLLSMYQMSGNEKVLRQAEDFGKRILPAFNSKTGLPHYWVNLKTGAVKGDTINVAEGGTYLIEMGMLSYYTSNPVYYQAAKKAMKAIYERRSPAPLNLISQDIDIETGTWLNHKSHIGACIDSYYEYMFKSTLLFHDPEVLDMWKTSIQAINTYLADDNGTRLWYRQVDERNGKPIRDVVTLYDAFFPALLALSGDIQRAERLQESWNDLWNRQGLEPMAFDYSQAKNLNASYDLNPEIMESAYYLFHFTQNPKYRERNAKYFADLKKYCRTDIAYTCVKDIVTKEKSNEMPTFFFAETMKYLYLTFSDEKTFKFDDYVFSTEAHPFRKDAIKKDLLKTRLGL